MKKLLLIFMFLGATGLQAQHTVSGNVTNARNEPLAFVNILEAGTTNGTTTDSNGFYQLTVQSSTATLVFSFIGYTTQEIILTGEESLDLSLVEDTILLQAIQVVGTRSSKRSSTDTPVPVDIINIREVISKSGQAEINQILQYVAPSFNATKQTGSDGADHIDPATLRGLGPDQTLVLINGKRRHQSSLVNIFGTRGRGNTGTDLNAIPVSAIERIEILRDGASAQYGSDAIAGVVNIVLRNDIDKLTGSVTYGAYNTSADGDFPTATPNTDGNRLDTEKDGNQIADDKSFDGRSVKLTANYGVGIGNGFLNVTSEFLSKEKTLRPGATFRRGFGEASIDGFNIFANSVIPISDKTEFYAFGGRNYRDTDAFAFTRNNPTARSVVSVYPDGFTPRITSVITDNSVSAGVRTTTQSGWNIDLNNTYGINNFHYYIRGTINASLEEASPTDMDAGGHQLSQNTSSLDFTKYFDDVMSGANLAFGLESRTENFQIFAGEPSSFGTFDINGLLVTRGDQVVPVDSITGDQRPGGSQGFPGYSPDNEVDRSRSNFALYADAELDLNDQFLVGVAGRFEDYSDFGSTFNYKLASRFEISNELALRGSVSSGFRAPSLVQIYYNLQFTNFIGGVPLESLLASNNSPVTAAFGIDQLKEEKAVNASLGFTLRTGNFVATVDGYFIKIDDRIILTGNFDASSFNIGVSDAQFFANGLDTETKGLDVVLSWRKYIGGNKLTAALIGNVNSMKVKNVKNRNLDLGTFWGARDEFFLLASAPDNKFSLNLGYEVSKFNASLVLTRFSEVELLGFEVFEFDDPSSQEAIDAARDVYKSKILTDLSLGYQLDNKFKLIIGANNLLNVYPSQQDSDWTEAGGFWDAVQMGYSGAYYFTRLDFNF